MKAKAYADRYKADPTPEALGRVCIDMFLEVEAIGKQRKVKTDAAVFGILNEVEQKWRAFVNLVNDETIRADGFIAFVHIKMPDVYYPWIDYRKATGR